MCACGQLSESERSETAMGPAMAAAEPTTFYVYIEPLSVSPTAGRY